MSYVELIVVLSIFAIMSSIAIFNYGDFQANVDIRNLASDIALQIVTAQKSALNGASPSSGFFCATATVTCKPSYGVYFDKSPTNDNSDNKPFNTKFIYFADLNNAGGYDPGDTSNIITITKGNHILNIDKCSTDSCDLGSNPIPISPLSVVFKRPDSGAVFNNSPTLVTGSEYIKITIESANKKVTSSIRIYPSGRVQIR